jgi:hypothetical protein
LVKHYFIHFNIQNFSLISCKVGYYTRFPPLHKKTINLIYTIYLEKIVKKLFFDEKSSSKQRKKKPLIVLLEHFSSKNQVSSLLEKPHVRIFFFNYLECINFFVYNFTILLFHNFSSYYWSSASTDNWSCQDLRSSYISQRKRRWDCHY